jgi:hypothetical protein
MVSKSAWTSLSPRTSQVFLKNVAAWGFKTKARREQTFNVHKWALPIESKSEQLSDSTRGVFEADRGRDGEVVVLRPRLVIVAGTCFFFLRLRGGGSEEGLGSETATKGGEAVGAAGS